MTASQKIFLHKLYWFVYDKLSSLFDFLLLPFPGKVFAEGKGKTIVFVGEQLPPRIARMAKWLKRSGDFTIYLVCSKQGFVKDFSGEGFDKVLLFRNKWHLFRIVSGFGPKTILHGFAPKSRLLNLVRKRSGLKYIHDMQDVYSIYYGLETTIPHLKIELPHERECLEKADAVVAQSLEPNIAYRMYGTKKKPRNIFFPLYCDDDQFQNNTKDLNGEIHLVYAGGVAGKHRDPKQYGNTQFHLLIESFGKQKIHFHIYPSPSNISAEYEEYRTLQKTHPFFHFHESIHQSQLAKEISKYHFGLMPFFKAYTDQSEAKIKYATTLKLFNYLEAGIPMIVASDLGYQSWMVRRNKAGFSVSRKDLDKLNEIVRIITYTELKSRVDKARKALSLKNNISRLDGLYSTISKE